MTVASTQKARRFPNLLSPITIGNVEIENRIAVAPMQEFMSGYHGEVTEQTLGYIGDEIGIWTERESVVPRSWETARMPALARKPWWREDIALIEKSWRPFRGPGPR